MENGLMHKPRSLESIFERRDNLKQVSTGLQEWTPEMQEAEFQHEYKFEMAMNNWRADLDG